jgi:hypothetical protein
MCALRHLQRRLQLRHLPLGAADVEAALGGAVCILWGLILPAAALPSAAHHERSARRCVLCEVACSNAQLMSPKGCVPVTGDPVVWQQRPTGPSSSNATLPLPAVHPGIKRVDTNSFRPH